MLRDSLEIHEKLQQNKREKEIRNIKSSIDSNNHSLPVRTRTAAIAHANYLPRSGAFTDHEVARHAKVSLYEVEKLKASIER
jgi:hypothetical protein